jgi:hypothetical protein
MSIHLPAEQLQAQADILAAPLRRNRAERVFDLHPAVHLMLAGLLLAFPAILLATFMGPDLVVAGAIVIIGALSLFITPALWAKVQPKDDRPRQSWAEFMAEGVECNTGHLSARGAMAQILVLPVLMVGLGFVFAVIKATL